MVSVQTPIFHYSGLPVCGLQAHFRFGFFVAAALAPDALLAGASFFAGFAAGLLLPANAPALLPFALGSLADRFRPNLDPAVPFSTLFDERPPLLSAVFFAVAEDDGLALAFLATEVAAFFKFVDAVVAFAGAALFFSTSVLDFFRGDFELDRPALAFGAAFSFFAGAIAVFADLGGETEVLARAIDDAAAVFLAFAAPADDFLDSSLALEALRLLLAVAFLSASFLSAVFLAGYLGGETLLPPFLEEDTAGVVTGFATVLAELLALARDFELERGTTEADLLAFTSLTAALRAAFWSRLRI